ncbi:MAG: sulfoxide reductase heme-binding subunit YedZ [Chloroflexi bacterium]|nr:sulfoxide reductase heme-binding subunit YedZ [Chloroflexota bacterium]
MMIRIMTRRNKTVTEKEGKQMAAISGRETAVSPKTNRKDHKKAGQRLTWVTHIGALVPLAVLLWEYQSNNLGADPVREILFHTGTTSIVLLVLSLAVTPVRTVLGWNQVVRLRRPLGLYTFFYVCLHLLTFVWLDYAFDLAFLIDGIIEQKFVLIGFAAFLLLIPLAITSTKGWQRRLGKRWKKLHKLSYLIIILVLIHFVWLVKNVYIEPGIYAGIVGLLFLARWNPVRQKLLLWQRRLRNKLAK